MSMSGQEFVEQLAAELAKPKYAEIVNRGDAMVSRDLAGLMNAPIPDVVDAPPQETITMLPTNVVELMALVPAAEKGPLSTAKWREVAGQAYPVNGDATEAVNSYLLQQAAGVDLYVDQSAQIVLNSQSEALVAAFLDALEAGGYLSAETKQAILESFQAPDPLWEPETWTFPMPSVANANGWPYVQPVNVESALAI